jgi:hypothetical protein
MTPAKSVPGVPADPFRHARATTRAEAVGVSPRHAGASRFAPRGAATKKESRCRKPNSQSAVERG